MNSFRRGYTLIEMLIVVTIIAVLAGVGYNYYTDIIPEARENTVRMNLNVVRDAISRYFKDNMAYPTSLEKLQGPYLQQPVQSLLVTPLISAAKVMVEVSSDIVAKPNIFQLAPAECTWIEYQFDGSGSGGGQIRNIKIKYNGVVMPW